MQLRVKYVVEDTDRHGNVRLYFRKGMQPKIRLPPPLGSPEFLEAYKQALAGKSRQAERKSSVGTVKPNSFRWLCMAYFQSAMFLQLDPRTKRVRRQVLERFCQNENDGEKPFGSLVPRHLRKRRDKMLATPEAANSMLKAVRQVYKFAVRYDYHQLNPAVEVEYLQSGSTGFHSWSLEEISAYEKTHPIGTTARLALALALYTGQRRADIVTFGRQHLRDGWLVFTQHKNRSHKPIRLEIPIVPHLQKIIDATPSGDLAFLVNSFGKPFTSNGFGNRFRKWCDEAGLNNCSVHGLRKAAAARLAESGCSEFEIMAITGHTTSKEVTRYTRAASQKTRAESALKRIMSERK